MAAQHVMAAMVIFEQRRKTIVARSSFNELTQPPQGLSLWPKQARCPLDLNHDNAKRANLPDFRQFRSEKSVRARRFGGCNFRGALIRWQEDQANKSAGEHPLSRQPVRASRTTRKPHLTTRRPRGRALAAQTPTTRQSTRRGRALGKTNHPSEHARSPPKNKKKSKKFQEKLAKN